MEKNNWFYLALTSLALSIASMFLPILKYTTTAGKQYTFTLPDLLRGSDAYESVVMEQYDGPVILELNGRAAAILGVLAVLAILCALIGLFSLRAQRPKTGQFVLTIIGLVGVSIPSLLLIGCVLGFQKYYSGVIQFGIAPILSPLAIVICLVAVRYRRSHVSKRLREEAEASGLIEQAGDL